ncbi:MAG: isoprenylcysteine carboxylmethyltransferase family protein [Sphingobacteriales bacterium]|nr:MAG: isoprenylcysteine carboxylmethyltransferase family protein [Sphingobacteriales bacterium]
MAQLNYFLVAYFITYLVVAFVWPSLRTYRQTGINPVTFGGTDTTHDLIGRWFKVLFALILLTIVIYWWDGSAYRYLLPAEYLQYPPVQWVGVGLCILSLLWTVLAQHQMGRSWHIGIDKEHNAELKISGLFAVSRNPIFLGMIVTLVGFLLVLPNAITLVVLTLVYVLIQVQIRLEEEFLLNQHDAAYQSYKIRVRRLV